MLSACCMIFCTSTTYVRIIYMIYLFPLLLKPKMPWLIEQVLLLGINDGTSLILLSPYNCPVHPVSVLQVMCSSILPRTARLRSKNCCIQDISANYHKLQWVILTSWSSGTFLIRASTAIRFCGSAETTL